MASSGIRKPSSYVTGDTLRLCYRVQSVNAVRFDVLAAVTMKNVVFWDIKTQFVPHRRHLRLTTESSLLMLCKI
jgi:hypothetical protein